MQPEVIDMGESTWVLTDESEAAALVELIDVEFSHAANDSTAA